MALLVAMLIFQGIHDVLLRTRLATPYIRIMSDFAMQRAFAPDPMRYVLVK